MKKTVLTFGLISGGIMAVMMFATLPHLICFVCNHMGDHVLRYSQLW